MISLPQFQALGLPNSGKVRVQPGDLEGLRAFVDIRPSEYQSPGGQLIRRNEVPYDGYRAVDRDSNGDPPLDQRSDTDSIPF